MGYVEGRRCCHGRGRYRELTLNSSCSAQMFMFAVNRRRNRAEQNRTSDESNVASQMSVLPPRPTRINPRKRRCSERVSRVVWDISRRVDDLFCYTVSHG